MPAIPDYMVLVLPAIVMLISGWLQHDNFPQWVNAAISGVVVLVSAFLCALLAQKMAGDLVTDFVLIASYCAALIAGPLKPLQQWLMVKLPSPFARLKQASTPAPFVPVTTPVMSLPAPPAPISQPSQPSQQGQVSQASTSEPSGASNAPSKQSSI